MAASATTDSPHRRSVLVPLAAVVVMTSALYAGNGLAQYLHLGTAGMVALGELALLAAVLGFIAAERLGVRGLGLHGGWKAADSAYVPAQLVGHFVVSIALGLLLTRAGYLRTEPRALGVLENLAAQPVAQALAGALLVAVLAGICEEVAFRGYLIPRLESAGLPTVAAVTISALAFGLVHVPGYGWLASLPKLLSFGLPVGFYFAHRRSLWPVMVAHFLVDFTGLALLVLAAHVLKHT